MSAHHAPAPRRMLLASFGTVGDMLPFIQLGQALQRRGHAVQLLAPSPHRALVQGQGLACLPYGTDEAFRAALLRPALTNPRTAFASLWPLLHGALRQVLQAATTGPADEPATWVLHPLLLAAAPLARVQRPGVPVVGAWLAPSNLRSCHDPLSIGPLAIPRWVPMAWRRALWRHVDRRFINGAVLAAWNAERAALGLPLLRDFLPHLQTVPDLSLMLFPDWFAPAAPDWPAARLNGPFPLPPVEPASALPEALQAFVQQGAAPVVCTLGTGNRHSRVVLAQLVRQLPAMGRRLVVLTADRSQLPETLPQAVRWLPWSPMAPLLARAAALVHHGGIGTTAEALRAGVPQLVLPGGFDQFDNARRVQALGVGLALPPGVAVRGGRRLTQGLQQLLAGPAWRDRARQVAALQAADAPLEALCPAVEALEALEAVQAARATPAVPLPMAAGAAGVAPHGTGP